MNRPTVAFCYLVSKLNRIPRYGRYYTLIQTPGSPNSWSRAHWSWQKKGWWGLYLLNRLGIFDQYMAHLERKRNGTP